MSEVLDALLHVDVREHVAAVDGQYGGHDERQDESLSAQQAAAAAQQRPDQDQCRKDEGRDPCRAHPRASLVAIAPSRPEAARSAAPGPLKMAKAVGPEPLSPAARAPVARSASIVA